MQPRQANTILTITRHFLTTASNLPHQHDKTLIFFGCQVLFHELPDFRRPTFRANVEPLFESFSKRASPFSEHQNVHSRCPPPPPLRAPNCLGARILELSSAQNTKTCTPARTLPLSEPKIAWEHAFWNFQAPKTLKRVLPLPSLFFVIAHNCLGVRILYSRPPPLRAQNCLGERILELSSTQNSKTCTPAAPAPLRAWEYAFWNFQASKTLKRVLPPAPPLQIAWEFWNFQVPKTLKRVLPLPPPLRAQNCLGARILELSSAENTKTCTPARTLPLSEPKIAWEHAFWNFQAPKTLKRVLPLPSLFFVRAHNCLGVRILYSRPPLSEPKIAWENAFWNFQAPKTVKRVLPLPPPLSEPGSTHFGTFKRLKH